MTALAILAWMYVGPAALTWLALTALFTYARVVDGRIVPTWLVIVGPAWFALWWPYTWATSLRPFDPKCTL